MTDVTRILSQIESSDPAAADLLLPLVYDELRRLAGERLAAEPAGNTLQPTALVHEAYLRLVGATNGDQWACRTRRNSSRRRGHEGLLEFVTHAAPAVAEQGRSAAEGAQMTSVENGEQVASIEEPPSSGVPIRRRVPRHSPDRLLRQPISVPDDVIVSAERCNGRLVVRIESARDTIG